MKATLVFSLPDDEAAHRLAVNARRYWTVLWDYDQWLRGLAKHSDEDGDWAEKARDKLHEMLAGEGVSLDDVE